MKKSEVFRNYLMDYFESKKEKDPSFSFRTLANQLEINSGNLSALISGRRNFTENRISKFCELLGLSEIERHSIFDENRFIRDSKELAKNQVESVSKWTHYAFLEMIQEKQFKYDARAISDRLGVSTLELQGVIETLLDSKLIQSVNGRFIPANLGTQVYASKTTSRSLKRLMISANSLSRISLENDPIERRYHAVNTLAIRPGQIEEAKKYLRKFREKFCRDLKWSGKNSEIYQLNLSFYSIEQGKRKKHG